jgi:hypothetical protein
MKRKSHARGGTKMKKITCWGWHKNKKKITSWGWHENERKNLMLGVAQN